MSWIPPKPIPAEVPTDLPPDFPSSLRLRTSVVLDEVVAEFSRSQLEPLCKKLVSRLTAILCEGVKEGTLQAYEAPSRLDTLLHYVRVTNCNNDNECSRVRRAVVNSDEWRAMRKLLLECENRSLNEAPLGETARGTIKTEPRDTLAAKADAGLWSCSTDYRKINFKGESFCLTEKQADIVRVLYEARATGSEYLTSKKIREKAKCGRVSDSFRTGDGPKLWKHLVVAEPGLRGVFRLNLPSL
jgi:hypothetical protein